MGHFTHALVAKASVAGAICQAYPQLSLIRAPRGFVLIPVDADFIDSVVEAKPPQISDAFMLLTGPFREFLRELSRLGAIAYIETEYHGGAGGQGAAVYANGEIVMEPQWSASGEINRALKLLGVRRRLLGDQFSALGLGKFRCNEDLIAALTEESAPN